ncbi:MAG: UDP-glucose 4-epimerase GalE [Salinarimonas sp.]
MSTVLVTGGAGYIGAQTCKALANAGYHPVVYDNLVSGHRSAVRWGPLVHGDIADRATLDAAIRTYRPQAAIHFAAHAYVGESIADPGKYYRNNLAGSLTLLEALRDGGVGKLVLSSTCAVYGEPAQLPITENTPPRPINPYGASKLMVEHMLADFERAHGLRWLALRYFNAAGDDFDGEIGEDHDPETRLVPLALDAASGGPPLTVYGSNYATPDGTCIRDYIHVVDLADAHVRALAALDSGIASQPLNLGGGRGMSVHEIIAMVEAITQRRVDLHHGPRREGDPPVLIADAGRARELLGWSPRYSDPVRIVESAWAWHCRKRERLS